MSDVTYASSGHAKGFVESDSDIVSLATEALDDAFDDTDADVETGESFGVSIETSVAVFRADSGGDE